MRILLCCPYPLEDVRGNSVAACRLVAGFRGAGHAVEVVAPPAVDDPAAVVATAQRFRPEVAMTMHAWRCAAAFRALALVGPVPRVVSLRGTDLNEMLDHPDTAGVVREVLEESVAVVVFHAAARQRLVRVEPRWAGKTVLIPNGAVLPRSEVDFRGRLAMPPEAFVFGAVGGLRSVKRPLLVLPWLERLRAEEPRLVWMHAGGPQEPAVAEELRRFARERPWVFHLDHVPPGEIDSFLRAADVIVATSRSEGMPHAVREAMLAGLPLLLSDIDGHRAMATPEQEALFFSDEAGFARQARRLWTDPALRQRLGKAAQARVETELARGDEIGSYLALFTRVSNRPGSSFA